MKFLFIILILSTILTSCLGTSRVENTSPYPTVPLGTTEVTFMPSRGGSYQASGTEPFWGATITATGTLFERPGESGTESKLYQTTQEEKDGFTLIKDIKGEFFITLRKESCNDGMSDNTYVYSATVSVGSENLRGCANKK